MDDIQNLINSQKIKAAIDIAKNILSLIEDEILTIVVNSKGKQEIKDKITSSTTISVSDFTNRNTITFNGRVANIFSYRSPNSIIGSYELEEGNNNITVNGVDNTVTAKVREVKSLAQNIHNRYEGVAPQSLTFQYRPN